MITYNYTQFVEIFKPLQNSKFPEGPYNGTLFYKGDPGFIASNINIKRVWSLIEETIVTDEIAQTLVTKRVLRTGVIAHPGLVGYMVTIKPYENSATEIQDVPIV